MSKFKAVLFDLDGTLINTINDLGNATNYMLKTFSYPQHDIESYKMKVGNGMRKLMERSLPKNHRTDEEIEKALGVFMPYYIEHSADETVPYEDIIPLLNELKLKNIKTAVVTNKAHISAVDLVDKFFKNLVDTVVGQTDKLPTKPSPDMVFAVTEALSVLPKECIFVGDSSVDMLTAKASGAYAVGVTWGFRSKQELIESGADVIIDNPLEILNLL